MSDMIPWTSGELGLLRQEMDNLFERLFEGFPRLGITRKREVAISFIREGLFTGSSRRARTSFIHEKEHTLVTTTGVHIARRIGKALSRACQSDFSIQYGDDEKSISFTGADNIAGPVLA